MNGIQNWQLDRYASMIPPVERDSNKYTRGSLLVIGGSQRYTGAPILAAMAGCRAGAGYVTLAVPDCMSSVARAHLLSVPVIGAKSAVDVFAADALDDILSQVNRIHAVVAGPGMIACESTATLLQRIFEGIEAPVVVDADALNIIASHARGLCEKECADALVALRARGEADLPTILTPHAGELKRIATHLGFSEDLTGLSEFEVRERMASFVCEETQAVVVAKGPDTIICSKEFSIRSSFGDASLATAGTGDVLSGIIGAFCAQGLEALEAASLGACVHGLAGRLAGETLGQRSVIAEDVIEMVAPAIVSLEA
ncbi:MAG: NAD(P)H-hydrate dehydratase [bacterium]|nr:NAD(P)H-hydrate dehydratase [bacterium]